MDQDAALWDAWAATYNEDSLGPAEPVAVVLAELADGGPALELCIGMGRVALPLAGQGVPVMGLDVSTEMLRRLEERRGALPVDYRVRDMGDFEPPGRYPLVYIVAGTFYLLADDDRQRSCLRSCSRVLDEGGHVVIEAPVPGSSALPLESGVIPRGVGEEWGKLSIVMHEPGPQLLHTQEGRLVPEGARMRLVSRRYVHLRELDDMAGGAGLRLAARYSGWDRAPFEDGQARHISVYSVSGELGGRFGDG
ncbi:class I SAM-dependent methyltransferase [Streptomyces sp. NPDC049915]|uniref:class I SAM-dependent methyltransferase n=1 Tax=Streptomyces sp. NPDC049915 TaxID=3155510 RepID=UPI0034150F3E